MDRRIQAPPSLWEAFAILLDIAIVGVFVYVQPNALHYDLDNYLKVAKGDFSFYYYAYWMVPLLAVLGGLPVTLVYLAWSVVSIAAVWFAVRVFGGRAVPVLISYQMFYVLFQGQLTGMVVGALGLLWWGMAHRRLNIAGLGMIIAATKFQTGILFGVILWLLAPLAWRERLRILIVPLAVALVSLVVYPGWFLTTIAVIQNNPPDISGSLALWRWLGPAALVLWLPPLLLPLPREKRIIALAATATLAVPYFQQTDLLALFVLPIGWLAWLGNLGYFIVSFDNTALQMLAIVPLLVYALILLPASFSRFRPSPL